MLDSPVAEGPLRVSRIFFFEWPKSGTTLGVCKWKARLVFMLVSKRSLYFDPSGV